jgi:poly(3-hydroxybutyrate) depolymerase
MNCSFRGWRSVALGAALFLAACGLGGETTPDASTTGSSSGGSGGSSSSSSSSGGSSGGSKDAGGSGGSSSSGGSSGGSKDAGSGGGASSSGSGSGGSSGSSGGSSGSSGGSSGSSGGSSGSSGGGSSSGGSNGGEGGAAVPSAGCGKEPSAKTGDAQKITVGGSSRTYNLRIPDNYDKNHPYRLMVSYHWLGGTADNVSKGGVAKPYYGLWDLAGGSTIFVAPQGNGNAWNNSGGADVEFSRQLITQLEDQLCIDKSRIFCEGFSMGGSMSYAMACGMGDVIRGVAVHSGGTMSGCAKHDKPVAYFMTHGIKDSVCTYPGFALPPLQDFAKMNGCKTPDPSLSQSAFEALLPEPTSSASACVEFTGCKQGYPVRSCLFVGDHTPSPDGTNGWVPKESWKFISQF